MSCETRASRELTTGLHLLHCSMQSQGLQCCWARLLADRSGAKGWLGRVAAPADMLRWHCPSSCVPLGSCVDGHRMSQCCRAQLLWHALPAAAPECVQLRGLVCKWVSGRLLPSPSSHIHGGACSPLPSLWLPASCPEAGQVPRGVQLSSKVQGSVTSGLLRLRCLSQPERSTRRAGRGACLTLA